ncbi:MAG: PD40 domain-containing protein [Chloroflexi bacterium]|nr:PD40 domain-containing protein [Chloroflexota bacterium]
MTNLNRVYVIAGILLVCSFLLFAAILAPGFVRLLSTPRTPTSDVVATFQALLTLTPLPDSSPSTATPSPDAPTGHIVFTCQIFKYQISEQICIMNADGAGYKRLTTDDSVRHFYPSMSPDGQNVVYSAFNVQSQHFEIYELNLTTGKDKNITYAFGDLNAPEISPDGKTIVFTRFFNDTNNPNIWLMDRTGGNFRQVSGIAGWDPTWSPDGKQILFASDRDGTDQLYIINLDGTGLRKVTSLPALRGRSDWSPDGKLIVTYSGDPWKREVYIMNADGSNLLAAAVTGRRTES